MMVDIWYRLLNHEGAVTLESGLRKALAVLWRLVSTPEGGLAVAVIAVAAFFAQTTPRFLTQANLGSAAQQGSIYLIIAVGITLTVLARGIDVSVGSTVAMGSVLGGMAAVRTESVVIGLLVPCLVGIAIGLANGLAIGALGLSPLIVTLASLSIFRGLALWITDGEPVTGLPEGFSELGNGSVGSLSYSTMVGIAVFLVFIFVLYMTGWGVRLYALGASPRAAAISGVRVVGITVSAYVLCGLLAGIAGAILSSRVNVGSPLLGQGLEFEVLPMVFLGGVVFMAGRGNLWGVLLSVVLMTEIINGLKIMGVQPFWQSALPGAALLGALVLQRVMGRSEVWASE